MNNAVNEIIGYLKSLMTAGIKYSCGHVSDAPHGSISIKNELDYLYVDLCPVCFDSVYSHCGYCGSMSDAEKLTEVFGVKYCHTCYTDLYTYN